MKITAWPCSLSRASDIAELRDALRRQHRRRLVEDQHAGAAPERLDDLDLLLGAEREVGGLRVGVDLDAEHARELGEPAARGGRARGAAARESPSMRFSSTVSAGIRAECWCTVPRPSSSATRGESIAVVTPSILIVPASGRTRPDRMPMSVDLPAPFSPSRQWTSPPRTVRLTSSFASTPGYRLVIPTISTIGVPDSAGAAPV